MSQPLFRDEVLKARRTLWLGGISLAQPLRLWVLTGLAVMAASAIVLFVTLGTYTRRSTVTGQLVPTQGLAKVVAPASRVVTRMDVAEGGQVTAGGTLALVSMPRTTQGSGDTQAALEQHLQQRQDGLVATQQAQHAQLRAHAQAQAQAQGICWACSSPAKAASTSAAMTCTSSARATCAPSSAR